MHGAGALRRRCVWSSIVVRLECRSLLSAEARRRTCVDGVEMLRMRVAAGTTTTLAAYPFQLPVMPASYHGGALVDVQWEAVMQQHGMWTNNRWFKVEPVTWWYTLVVELDVPSTSFDLTKEFPFCMCSIPQMVQYVLPPQLVAAAQPIAAMAQPIDGMYSGGDDDAPPQAIPLVVAEAVPLDSLTAGAAPPIAWGPQPGLESTEHRMDYDGVQRNPVGSLSYAPAFPVAVAAMPPLSEADAAYSNTAPGGVAVPPHPAQIEVMVRSDP